MELALACDVVVAADDALLGDGHVRNQLFPAGGASVRLQQRVGISFARYLALTGELVPASQFSSCGWLHATVPAARLERTAQGLAEQLAAAAGPAQTHFRHLMNATLSLPPEQGLEAELEAFATHWESAPVAAALRAFLTDRTEVPQT
ncbi:enoyl-CoA hydratase/isomerase family protein [Streptomyces sp. NPDC057257]|uniref:enoyl-CoA hydratase/isomerase family protein n=1 Tax=Streptomyces sp. NPDC057257 TaxID=3346071 RepID=UPI00363134E1